MAQNEWEKFKSMPGRVFLDSSVLQTMDQYGEFIFNDGELPPNSKILTVPDGLRNSEALQNIVLINHRSSFQLALSSNSIKEVRDKRDPGYLRWAFEMLDYWNGCLESYDDASEAFNGKGESILKKLNSAKLGFLSEKDKRLILDAVMLECDAFMTMDRRLAANAPAIKKLLGILVVTPYEFWDIWKPYAALFR